MEMRSRKDHRGVDLISDALPFGSAMVWRTKRNQQRNRLRKVFQPFTWRCNSRLRWRLATWSKRRSTRL